jgi:hypothetical protein
MITELQFNQTWYIYSREVTHLEIESFISKIWRVEWG